ncbi:GRF-type domain-containing protein [Heracleum sosnowskyi]|uniref:GRF-type domain-containing protein n=1 Tax=Heracleum sosnowskyi TaxID=360622 RepID=A0AAD8GW50_9APIA|nr:GRF-type domain-containing protein [Heracleum sosnowskyi]
MATLSTSSVGLDVRLICDCGKRAKMYTSWSLKNTGRRFYTCCQNPDNRCDYFEWYGVEVAGRNGDVITHLNNRRIFLEEKINLLEEKITVLEQDIRKKKEKKRALKKKNVQYMKVMFGVNVVFLAMLLMAFIK